MKLWKSYSLKWGRFCLADIHADTYMYSAVKSPFLLVHKTVVQHHRYRQAFTCGIRTSVQLQHTPKTKPPGYFLRRVGLSGWIHFVPDTWLNLRNEFSRKCPLCTACSYDIDCWCVSKRNLVKTRTDLCVVNTVVFTRRNVPLKEENVTTSVTGAGKSQQANKQVIAGFVRNPHV